jgi:hypothetical protein
VSDPFELESKHDDPAYAQVIADLEARRAAHPRGLMINMIGKRIPAGTEGEDYLYVIPVWGGEPPYTWDLNGSQLPAGLALDPTTGVLSGRPEVEGEHVFQVVVTDSGERLHAGGPRRLVKDIMWRVAPGADGGGLLDTVDMNTRALASATDTGVDPPTAESGDDGWGDGEEVAAGSDPNDGLSVPASVPIPALSLAGLGLLALGLLAAGRNLLTKSGPRT